MAEQEGAALAPVLPVDDGARLAGVRDHQIGRWGRAGGHQLIHGVTSAKRWMSETRKTTANTTIVILAAVRPALKDALYNSLSFIRSISIQVVYRCHVSRPLPCSGPTGTRTRYRAAHERHGGQWTGPAGS